MADLLSGALVGAVVGELLKAVLDAKDKAKNFRPVLERMATTLGTIEPLIEETEQFNRTLDHRKEEAGQALELLKKGKKLVQECSRIRWYMCWKRVSYSDKLVELEESLDRFYQIVVAAQTNRNTAQILVEVKETNRLLHGITSVGFGSCAVPGIPGELVGLEMALGELKIEVFKEGASMVVLSAPPGCGKTTLAKLFCHDPNVQETFKDNIFFVFVSKTPTLEGLVQRLFQHKGRPMPECRNDEDTVNQLEQFLRSIGSKPILLVLDDVWPESRSLLHKFKFQIPGYKVLVTSRSEFPGFGSAYKLKPLNYESSMALFRKYAFPEGQSSDIPADTLNKIVKGCKGYPIALKVVGSELCGQPEEKWKVKEMELSKTGTIPVFEYSDLLSCLKKSLDALNKDVLKQCFMDLCSFPEDDRIPVTALIDMWVELYSLDEDGIHAVDNIQELSIKNLIELIVTRKDGSGSYNQHFIMQHDLLRELAIHQINSASIEKRKRLNVEIIANNFPDWWMERKSQSISSRLLSIFTDAKFSTSWLDLEATEVEVLVLNFRTRNYTFPEFLQKMGKLKTLIATNHSFFPTEFNNFPLLSSLPNLKRIRFEQASIPPCSFSSAEFSSLRKMTLILCRIGKAFNSSTIPVSEALPNLEELNIDYCSDLEKMPVGICQIKKLRKLCITNCHSLVALPEEIGELVNLQILRLASCTVLNGLPEAIGSLSKLSSLDISECFEIKGLPEQIGELQNLRKVHMMGCRQDFDLPSSILNLDQLQEVICDEETSSAWEPFTRTLRNLRIKVQKEDLNLNSFKSVLQ